jgi:peptidoglycan/xylan/chitin deacetylase (PgdA/CDA1 family)
MLEPSILLLVTVGLAVAGLAPWRLLRGPARTNLFLALRLATLAVVAGSLVTFSAWKLSKARTWQLFGEIVARVETDERVVALTFDDGPSAEYTEEVLALLGERGVKATFFVTGRALTRKPEEGRRIVEKGHELGNHSFSHKRMVLRSFSDVKKEIEETDARIQAAGYEGEIHFRSPGGKKLIVLPYYLWRTGRRNIFWDIAPEGYSGLPDEAERAAGSAQRIVEQVLAEAQPGSIILLHVMAKGRPVSREALPGIIEGLLERGYRFVTVSELLDLQKD